MAGPAAAAPWVRGFVVGSYEYAFHYGGRHDFARSGEVEPGVDCPHGSTTYFASEASAKRVLSHQKWRSQQEIDWVTHPPGLEKVRAPNLTQRHIWHRALAYRGWRRDIETYVNPSRRRIPASRRSPAASATASIWTARPAHTTLSARMAKRASTTRSIGPGVAMRLGGAMAMPRSIFGPTTRCRKGCTPWWCGSPATRIQ